MPDNQNQQTNSVVRNKIVGGGCEGCEIMFVGIPANISSIDTSPGWRERGKKLLVKGTVYNIDGKTPVSDVIIYYWQTDNNGYYSPKDGMDEKAKRHGHIRGWVKSDKNGKYSIYTIRPVPYPGDNIPAHIHVLVKEPDIENEYYIDEFVFEDDKLLTDENKNGHENRGGSGVLSVLLNDDLQIAEHNIILGLNIPDYPEEDKSE
jgi:protocatechuate 3,4-dioxygenase beta subunit